MCFSLAGWITVALTALSSRGGWHRKLPYTSVKKIIYTLDHQLLINNKTVNFEYHYGKVFASVCHWSISFEPLLL